jgi:hypothetical protein
VGNIQPTSVVSDFTEETHQGAKKRYFPILNEVINRKFLSNQASEGGDKATQR